MKLLTLIITLIASTTALANSNGFTAEVVDNQLHITQLLDTCNSHGLHIKAASNCSKADTADFVTTCEVDYAISSTKMACDTYDYRTLTVDLEQINLRKTIDTLAVKRKWVEEPRTLVSYTQPRSPNEPNEPLNYFDAIVVGDELYITVLLDSCNNHSPEIKLAQNCTTNPGGIQTTDYVTTCQANLSVISTEIYCPIENAKLHSFSFSIKDMNLRSTVDTLSLNNWYSPRPINLKIK